MIRKTVYFRTQEDLDKFNALPNKAEWLHSQINGDELFNIGMDLIGADEESFKTDGQMYSDEVRMQYVNNLKQKMREQLAFITDHHDELKELQPEYQYLPFEPTITPAEDVA